MAKEHNNKYKLSMNNKTVEEALAYKQKLIAGEEVPGEHLGKILGKKQLSKMTNGEFLQCILTAKEIQIFTESAIKGGGKDWNDTELSILGDIGVAVSVTIYDNMKIDDPEPTSSKNTESDVNAKLRIVGASTNSEQNALSLVYSNVSEEQVVKIQQKGKVDVIKSVDVKCQVSHSSKGLEIKFPDLEMAKKVMSKYLSELAVTFPPPKQSGIVTLQDNCITVCNTKNDGNDFGVIMGKQLTEAVVHLPTEALRDTLSPLFDGTQLTCTTSYEPKDLSFQYEGVPTLHYGSGGVPVDFTGNLKPYYGDGDEC